MVLNITYPTAPVISKRFVFCYRVKLHVIVELELSENIFHCIAIMRLPEGELMKYII